ncbi:hypothetical protein OIE66_16200 [Nonomuraea sp. NBC_01738]|uniref:hypothetical protein n=1 Tax=Nonomuraea sp. NBC_01738 TaxID=2976003 RepID=UPI002E1177A2|nr:hypothetical protein OIE66_16200 [Nonomuraea sp. NBC_01738]
MSADVLALQRLGAKQAVVAAYSNLWSAVYCASSSAACCPVSLFVNDDQQYGAQISTLSV